MEDGNPGKPMKKNKTVLTVSFQHGSAGAAREKEEHIRIGKLFHSSGKVLQLLLVAALFLSPLFAAGALNNIGNGGCHCIAFSFYFTVALILI